LGIPGRHGYDLKKRGAFIRIRFRRFFGKAVPDYGYEMKHFPIQRYLLEVVIDILFALMGTKFARFILERISPRFMGYIFKKLRTVWKRVTSKIKHDKLHKINDNEQEQEASIKHNSKSGTISAGYLFHSQER